MIILGGQKIAEWWWDVVPHPSSQIPRAHMLILVPLHCLVILIEVAVLNWDIVGMLCVFSRDWGLCHKVRAMILCVYMLSLLSMVFLKLKVLVTQICLTLWDPTDCKLQAPLSIELFRQECWSRLMFPSSGDLSHPGVEPRSPALQADSLLSEPPRKPQMFIEGLLCIGF